MIKFEFVSWVALSTGIAILMLCAAFPNPKDLKIIYLASALVAVAIAGIVQSLFNRPTDEE